MYTVDKQQAAKIYKFILMIVEQKEIVWLGILQRHISFGVLATESI